MNNYRDSLFWLLFHDRYKYVDNNRYRIFQPEWKWSDGKNIYIKSFDCLNSMKNVDRRYFEKPELAIICIVETISYEIHSMMQSVDRK